KSDYGNNGSNPMIFIHIRMSVLLPHRFVRPKSMLLPFVPSPSRSRFYPTSADLKCRTRASPSSVGEGTIIATAFVVPHDVKQPVGWAEREQKPITRFGIALEGARDARMATL